MGRRERREEARALAKEIMRGGGKKGKTFETFLTIILALIPWGFSMPIAWKITLWAVSWALLLHMGLTAGKLRLLSVRSRVAIASTLTVVLSYVVACPVVRSYREEKANAYDGEIRPRDGWSPSSSRQLRIGENGPTLRNADPNRPLIDMLYDDLQIKRENDGTLLLSTRIRDRAGNVVVKITDNVWEVSHSASTAWQWNYTADALEVKDGNDRVVLQVKALPDRFQLQGEWRDERGNLWVVREFRDEKGVGGEVGNLNDKGPRQPPIQPIFMYPSRKYWGIYAEAKQPVLCTQHFLLLPCAE